MLLILQPTGIRGRKIRSARVHWIKSVISTKWIEPDWYFRLLFLVLCGNSSQRKKNKTEIPPAVYFRCALKTERNCLFYKINVPIQSIRHESSSSAKEWNWRGISRFCSHGLYVRQGVHLPSRRYLSPSLPPSSTDSWILAVEPHVPTVCSSSSFLQVWEVLTFKKTKQATNA